MLSTVFKIKGTVQHYSWGGYEFIPRLLGIENKEQKPFAEYWLGAHPNHPSFIEGNNSRLSDFIAARPSEVLGREVTPTFSTLPFLFKVLDVRQMLSIQVHPDKQSAAAEYAKENERGVSLQAPDRNYKDENHKPELMVALGEFWLLHGFKKEEALKRTLQAIPGFEFLLPIFNRGGYKGLYEEVMSMSQERVNEVLQPLVQMIAPLYQNQEFTKEQEDFWAGRAALHFCKDGHYDRGIFSIYFFNLVCLQKGEGIFQPQGLPHAYLEGQNIEVMANSDNVLRAGLTDKHIDVAELMKHVAFRPTVPAVLNPAPASHRIFFSPAEEFELHQYQLVQKEETVEAQTAEIWFLTKGAAKVLSEDGELPAHKGEGFFITAGTRVHIKPLEETEAFKVLVPVEKKRAL